NFKTTIVLLGLALAAGAGWVIYALVGDDKSAAKPPAILQEDVRRALRAGASKVPVQIELEYGSDRVQLRRAPGKTEGTLPGDWPSRPLEVKEFVKTLAGLESRFVAQSLTGDNKKDFGLDKPAVKLRVEVGDTKQVLEFGKPVAASHSKEGAKNLYYQPTYV